ncbi:NrfD/PsrC family molybdoenzyme membrane anchor subunit, partial [Chloroflexota bacterium]
MRPYAWMIDHTPQTEWIKKQGILFWLAFFFIELGAGTFIVSSVFNNLPGMLVGWLICATLGGGLHLIYLGHPLRFWRMLISSGWKTSWISRGLYFVMFFLLLGAIHMILVQWASPSLSLLIIADVFAFLVVIYGGFAMNYVNSIPLWNTGLLPVLYLIAGLWGGAGVLLITMLVTGTPMVAAVEEWARIF